MQARPIVCNVSYIIFCVFNYFLYFQVWQSNAAHTIDTKQNIELDNQNRSPTITTTLVLPICPDGTQAELMDNQSVQNSYLMENGPVIKMGLGALASRKNKGKY